jgi:hypothetical protein
MTMPRDHLPDQSAASPRYADATFINGKLAERPDDPQAADAHAEVT